MVGTLRDLKIMFQGDSGGPLVCKGVGDPAEGPMGVLVGVVAGAQKSVLGRESFFTRVSSYRTFINKYKSSSCRVNILKWLVLLLNGVFLLF